MTDTYKGFPIPEIMPDGKLYHIICDEGIFDGHSEIAVLNHWKNKVNVILKKRAIEDGYEEIEALPGAFICPKCGSMVFDSWGHTNWHENFTRLTHFRLDS